MKTIQDYQILETISETEKSVIYRARRKNDSLPVVIKILKNIHPSPSEQARFRQEYNLIKKLALDGVVRTYEIIVFDNNYAIVFEDFKGISLKDHIHSSRPDLGEFFRIAIRIAEILGSIHGRNIVHRDIKPQNVLINAESGVIKITDFGIAAELTHEKEEIYDPEVLSGTLAYMSPEQTGRMNRAVDYRTDLYSLGVCCYEMLTGGVPFSSNDPLELIHSHIARKPLPPESLNPSVPAMVSLIVQKLLAKTAEDRYQNAFGLASDLKKCREKWISAGRIDAFELAREDISIKFNIPQMLVGRKEEMFFLKEAFDRVASGPSELVLVSGDPGIGKSALINDLHKYIVSKRAYFVSGKYEKFRRDVPYSSLIQALQLLARQILTESRERIGIWRKNLLEALGPNGRIITDVIPEIEAIIGSQPEVQALGPGETQNRFHMVFRKFISVFSGQDHPVVFFLDDMQWIDTASLDLMKMIISDSGIRHFLLIGAYRDREVAAGHPLISTIEEVRKSGIKITAIELPPLSTEDINELISNFLRCAPEASLPLTCLVYEKTHGNPFFINQFLKTLYESGMLVLTPSSGWEWDVEKISQLQVTENVVVLMAEKISRLPESTQEILKICSCIGNRFDLETLALVMEKPIDDILQPLNDAINEGMINFSQGFYKFHHDRIQEAAYSLIPVADRTALHYRIGMRALESAAGSTLQENIFYIVNQINSAAGLVRGTEEKTRLAGLNLIAGSKAKDSTAYSSAVTYLRTGAGLLTAESWRTDYDTTVALNRELMESEYLAGNLDEAERLFSYILANVKTGVEKAGAYSILIELYTTRGRMLDAVQLGLRGLAIMGVKIPPNPGKPVLLKELVKIRLRLRRHGIENIPSLPRMEDREKLAVVELINNVGSPAYYTSPDLFALIVMKLCGIYLSHGNSSTAAFAYIALASIMGSALGDYESGRKLAETALALNESFGNRKIMAKVHHIFAFFIQHWTGHARRDLEYSRMAYFEGMDSGDLMYAGHSINVMAMTQFIIGENIDDILQNYRQYDEFQRKSPDPFIASNYADNIQVLLCLKGQTQSRISLTGDRYSEEKRLERIRAGDNLLDLFYHLLARMKILFLYDMLHDCLKIARELETLIDIPMGNLHVAEFYFYYSLTLTSLYPSSFHHEKRIYWKKLKSNMKKMKTWAGYCPENFLHKYLLIQAEVAAILGNRLEAGDLYHRAVLSAHENSYLQNEAIADELAGRFYLDQGYDEIARLYLSDARYAYQLWGAAAKMKHLEEKHPRLLQGKKRKSDELADSSLSPDSMEASAQSLDMSTVMKASQVISSEINLEKLLMNLMIIAMENAGAERGFLILEKDGAFVIEAKAEIDSEKISILQGTPVESTDELSSALVLYVARTKESVILNDAAREGMLTLDPYVIRTRPRSVLCDPIINQGKLTGILYLENNLTTGAFTHDRLKILRILSSQISISIDNARLYMNLENKVKERTAQLEEISNQLWGEMKLAKKIQTVLLPDRPQMNGYSVVGHMIPAEEVGGDYYDIINSPYADWVVIGDVSGHGLSAGLVMMMVQSTVQSILREDPGINPSELLRIVNRGVTYNIKKLNEDMFMTMTAFSFFDDGRVVHAGLHLDILVYRAATAAVETVKTSGMWLGIVPDVKKFNHDSSFILESGDTALIFSDGLVEARDSDLQMYDLDRLIETYRECGSSAPETIRERILDSLRGYNADDDITMVIVKKD